MHHAEKIKSMKYNHTEYFFHIHFIMHTYSLFILLIHLSFSIILYISVTLRQPSLSRQFTLTCWRHWPPPPPPRSPAHRRYQNKAAVCEQVRQPLNHLVSTLKHPQAPLLQFPWGFNSEADTPSRLLSLPFSNTLSLPDAALACQIDQRISDILTLSSEKPPPPPPPPPHLLTTRRTPVTQVKKRFLPQVSALPVGFQFVSRRWLDTKIGEF